MTAQGRGIPAHTFVVAVISNTIRQSGKGGGRRSFHGEQPDIGFGLLQTVIEPVVVGGERELKNIVWKSIEYLVISFCPAVDQKDLLILAKEKAAIVVEPGQRHS